MTAHAAREQANKGSKPSVLTEGHLINGRVRCIRASVNLSAVTIADGDTLDIGTRPKGSRYVGHRTICGVSLGSTTLAIGTAGSAGKYRAAATHTGVNAPADVALAAQVAADPLAADEDMIATFAAAAAPTSDHWLIIETYYTYD